MKLTKAQAFVIEKLCKVINLKDWEFIEVNERDFVRDKNTGNVMSIAFWLYRINKAFETSKTDIYACLVGTEQYVFNDLFFAELCCNDYEEILMVKRENVYFIDIGSVVVVYHKINRIRNFYLEFAVEMPEIKKASVYDFDFKEGNIK